MLIDQEHTSTSPTEQSHLFPIHAAENTAILEAGPSAKFSSTPVKLYE